MNNSISRLTLTIAVVLCLTACASLQQILTKEEVEDAKSVTHARFVPEKEDDFAWENDKVAFRVYGPASSVDGPISGVEAWFKSVDYPIVDKWYKAHLAGESFLENRGEGYQGYHVGTSRGVGGTAIWIDGKPYPAGAFSDAKVLSNDGQTVVIELSYQWETPLGLVSEIKRISLSAGSQLYHVIAKYQLNGEPAVLPIAIGLTTHDGAAKVDSDTLTGRISTWELIDNSGVGTGVLITPDRMEEVIHTPLEEKDASHIWIIASTDQSGVIEYQAGFTWAGAQEIVTKSQWTNYLDSYQN